MAGFGFPRIARPLGRPGGGSHSLGLDGTYLDAVYAVVKVPAKRSFCLAFRGNPSYLYYGVIFCRFGRKNFLFLEKTDFFKILRR